MHEIKFSLSDRQLRNLHVVANHMRQSFKLWPEYVEAFKPLMDALEKAANPPIPILVGLVKKEG